VLTPRLSVSRFTGKSSTHEYHVILDFNSDLFQIHRGDQLDVSIRSTLPGLEASSTAYDPSRVREALKNYGADYAMSGTVFRFDHAEDKSSERLRVYISFGGLICELTGPAAVVSTFELDNHVYLLLTRRV
jgi:DNA-directed RNA polymerase I, II, and III subunit RPABC3